MKIAIVAPSPVPYTVGGAEKLWWGLLHAINQGSRHEVELIKVPSPERHLGELLASYRRFAELDLDHFDMLLSTKYPAWMVPHRNHNLYLQHRLRGLYDTYPGELPRELPSAMPCEFDALRVLLGQSPERGLLPALWTETDKLLALAEEDEMLASQLAFPGPLSRQLVHFLDRIALAPGQIKRYSAISRNVAGRQNYFPSDVPVQVVHHPSDLVDYRNTGYDYLFTVSRLDGPKRIAMLIEAFKMTDADIEFRIAGTGPLEAQLRALATDDARISFLGRLTDAEILAQYAGALFVPYAPYDEDYGLVTIEAMSSGKAVLTTRDAGGVNEFVDSGVNGVVVEPDAVSLAAGMRTLIADPGATRWMGTAAQRRVAPIDWPSTVAALLDEPGKRSTVDSMFANQASARKKILVTVPFPVWPPDGGGQSRVFNLYAALAREADITLLTVGGDAGRIFDQLLVPGLRELRIGKSSAHLLHEQEMSRKLDASVADIAAIEGILLNPDYLDTFSRLAREADIVIASHPYLHGAAGPRQPPAYWYEAHNVEADMKAAVLAEALGCDDPARRKAAEQALALARQIEGACVSASQGVLVCSNEDSERLQELYDLDPALVALAPNGVSIDDTSYVNWSERQALRNQMDLDDTFRVLFMGSYHLPNIEAVEALRAIAGQLESVEFLLLGTVCEHPLCTALPANVRVLGLVSEQEKQLLLGTVNLVLNPMRSGSGTNLKMLDYAAAGTPILTTAFGNRGLDLRAGREVLIAELDEFATIIDTLQQHWQGDHTMESVIGLPGGKISVSNLTESARRRTESTYDWNIIARRVAKSLAIS